MLVVAGACPDTDAFGACIRCTGYGARQRLVAAPRLVVMWWSGLLEQGLHLLDFRLLGVDDLLCELAGVGVAALGQFGLGHVDGALVMDAHVLEKRPLERGAGHHPRPRPPGPPSTPPMGPLPLGLAGAPQA